MKNLFTKQALSNEYNKQIIENAWTIYKETRHGMQEADVINIFLKLCLCLKQPHVAHRYCILWTRIIHVIYTNNKYPTQVSVLFLILNFYQSCCVCCCFQLIILRIALSPIDYLFHCMC
eukprot:884418_1